MLQYVSPTEISNLRIYTIKISSKKYFMNQNRRFTRKAATGFDNWGDQESKNKDDVHLRTRINQAIDGKHFNRALTLLRSAAPESHWAACYRARVLFEQGSLPRALSAVRTFIKTERNGCQSCFQLLLNIIDKNRPEINKFNNDIQSCLSYEKLPGRLRTKFEGLRSQLETKQDISQNTTRQFQQLTNYYEHKGLLFGKVQIVEVNTQYRVARAKSNIKPNEIIIFVPEREMMTLEMAKKLHEVSKLAEEECQLKSPKHCMLSVFLLIHLNKGKSSPYFNYIQCLPKKLQNFPIYYSDQLLQQLQGTYFLTILKRKKAEIQEDFQEIISIVPSLRNQITYDKFVWARMIVSSRIFGVMINGKKTDTLVPIADMLNHKAPKLTTWFFSDQKRGFIVQNSNHFIQKGQQIFDSYGSKCNSRFLLNYGFTLPQNTSNEVLIMLKKPKKSKINPPNIRLSTCLNSDQFRVILSYYRQTIYESHNPDAVDLDNMKIRAAGFISNENECEVWRMMQQTMKQQLHTYKTTLKQDEKILRSSGQLSFNLRNCIEIRLGEKRILQFYLKISKKVIEQFSNKRKTYDISEYEKYMEEILHQRSSSSE